jgi:hypothetical protein
MENNTTNPKNKKNLNVLKEMEEDLKNPLEQTDSDDLGDNENVQHTGQTILNRGPLPGNENGIRIDEQSNVVQFPSASNNTANSLDGYYPLDNDLLPDGGRLYPSTWRFAYRCPTAIEVANFSTVTENDQAGMIQVIEDLIRKCVVIFDSAKDIIVDSGEILDGHRTFFLLKIREVFLSGQPLKYTNVCSYCQKPYDSVLEAHKLKFKRFKDKFYENFDGRVFTHVNEKEGIEIRLYVPTVTITSKIFKHIVKVYRNQSVDKKHQPEDKSAYDKLFLLLSPYLFERPSQSIQEIKNKYLQIKKNDKLLNEYLYLVDLLKFNNEEEFDEECPNCGSTEESAIRFPDGFQNLFMRNKSVSEY